MCVSISLSICLLFSMLALLYAVRCNVVVIDNSETLCRTLNDSCVEKFIETVRKTAEILHGKEIR